MGAPANNFRTANAISPPTPPPTPRCLQPRRHLRATVARAICPFWEIRERCRSAQPASKSRSGTLPPRCLESHANTPSIARAPAASPTQMGNFTPSSRPAVRWATRALTRMPMQPTWTRVRTPKRARMRQPLRSPSYALGHALAKCTLPTPASTAFACPPSKRAQPGTEVLTGTAMLVSPSASCFHFAGPTSGLRGWSDGRVRGAARSATRSALRRSFFVPVQVA